MAPGRLGRVGTVHDRQESNPSSGLRSHNLGVHRSTGGGPPGRAKVPRREPARTPPPPP